MKKFVTGILVGAGLMLSAQVLADDGLQMIEAYLRPDLLIKLDGKQLELKNPPIIYDGSTYLPLREMAGIFGKDVNWNNDTQTVELGKRDSQKSTYEGLESIVFNGTTYVDMKQYADLIASKNPNNVISYNEATSTMTLKLNGEDTPFPFNDENVHYVDGSAYLNVKFLKKP